MANKMRQTLATSVRFDQNKHMFLRLFVFVSFSQINDGKVAILAVEHTSVNLSRRELISMKWQFIKLDGTRRDF